MKTTTKSTPARRGRPRKVESYADWMSRVDAEVDAAARSMERKPPTYAYLHPAQKRIVQMLIEHMRSLPELRKAENCWEKKEYLTVNRIVRLLFAEKYPEWEDKPRLKDGWDVSQIPNQEGKVYEWMMRNCAGRSPAKVAARDTDDDDCPPPKRKGSITMKQTHLKPATPPAAAPTAPPPAPRSPSNLAVMPAANVYPAEKWAAYVEASRVLNQLLDLSKRIKRALKVAEKENTRLRIELVDALDKGATIQHGGRLISSPTPL